MMGISYLKGLIVTFKIIGQCDTKIETKDPKKLNERTWLCI